MDIFNPVHFKIETLTNIIGSDPKVLVNLLEEIVKGSERIFEQLNANFESESWKSLKNNAHFLKSNFRYLGNTDMMNLLKNIELFASDDVKRTEIPKLIQEFNASFPSIINEVKEYLQQLKG